MNKLIKTTTIATVLWMSGMSIAYAAPRPQEIAIEPSQPVLLAQAIKTYKFSPRAMVLVEMANQAIAMQRMGETAMLSSDPEVRKMGQEMVKTAEDQLKKLAIMMRQEFLANPDR
jgi:hypothetical protein